MAFSGTNGANETKIDLSMSIELKLFDSLATEIQSYTLPNSMDIWIARDPWFTKPNLINTLPSKDKNIYETIYYSHLITNASICLDIYHSESHVSYIALFNKLPNGKLESNNYDYAQVLCNTSNTINKINNIISD